MIKAELIAKLEHEKATMKHGDEWDGAYCEGLDYALELVKLLEEPLVEISCVVAVNQCEQGDLGLLHLEGGEEMMLFEPRYYLEPEYDNLGIIDALLPHAHDKVRLAVFEEKK
jgi:hypothetical protein